MTRAQSDHINSLIDNPTPVHKHGFVRVVDYMGDDRAIVQAARVSYGDGTKSTREDQALINYLMRHRHTSPFEMCELKLHLKMPIFVARQWVRHRTASMNEVSARYSVLKDEFYVPKAADVAAQATNNKQGRGETLSEVQANGILGEIKAASEDAHYTYEWLLDAEEHGGIARELARIVLPLNTYTEFYWKIDLHNLLHFLKLRLDSHAQKEIRDYAEVIAGIVAEWVPMTWKAFDNYVLNSFTLSRDMVELVSELIDGRKLHSHNLSERELNELRTALSF